MGKIALSLLMIGSVCGGLLVATDYLTAADIQLNRETRARALMSEMLGAPLAADQDIHGDASGDCAAWVFQRVSTRGYAGTIEVLALWRGASDGLSLRVVAHRETPGIGDFIDHTRDPWITRYDNLPAARIADADNVSGATITTEAIKRAAANARQLIRASCGQQL